MKKHFCVLIIVIAIVSFYSCHHSEKKNIYLLLKTLNNPFFYDMKTGVEAKAKGDYNVIVKAGNKENDIEAQIQVLQTIIEEANSSPEDIAGILITPTSSKNELIPYLKQLRDKNIPIIIIDTKIDGILLNEAGLSDLPFIASSNVEGGRQAGRIIINLIEPGAEVLLLNGVEGQETATERKIGFYSVIDTSSKKPIITPRTANWNRQEALTTVSSLYSAGKKYTAIFAANDEMALGSLQAILNENISPKPIIVGFDATNEARESVKKKGLNATIAQNPYKMGEEAVNMLNAIKEKKTFEKNYLIPTEIIDK